MNFHNLSEKHKCVVSSEVLGEELNTVTLQSRDGVLLCRVQSRHHSLWTDVDLIRIKEPIQRTPAKKKGAQSDIRVVICSIIWKNFATKL